MDKMERDGRNKTLYRCRFNYALSKLIVVNGLEDLWRRENPDSSELTHYDRSSGTKSRIDRVYTDIKIASNSLLCKSEFSSTTKTFHLLKTQNTATLQQMTGRETLNLVLKKMLELF